MPLAAVVLNLRQGAIPAPRSSVEAAPACRLLGKALLGTFEVIVKSTSPESGRSPRGEIAVDFLPLTSQAIEVTSPEWCPIPQKKPNHTKIEINSPLDPSGYDVCHEPDRLHSQTLRPPGADQRLAVRAGVVVDRGCAVRDCHDAGFGRSSRLPALPAEAVP